MLICNGPCARNRFINTVDIKAGAQHQVPFIQPNGVAEFGISRIALPQTGKMVGHKAAAGLPLLDQLIDQEDPVHVFIVAETVANTCTIAAGKHPH